MKRGNASGSAFLPRRVFVAVTVILAAGALCTWWTIDNTRLSLRQGLLHHTQLIAETVNLQRIRALAGNETDISTPDYHRLKDQLAAARTADEQYRFLYLMGRRADGGVFFLLDSEPSGSEHESPPGQVYDEITPEDLRVFEDKQALVSGPAVDRWGTWVSALVPLIDPRTGELVAVLGGDYAARDWLRTLWAASLPPILLTAVTLMVLTLGTVLSARHIRLAPTAPARSLSVEPALTVAVVGIFLSFAAGWIAYNEQDYLRQNSFRQLADDRTDVIARSLHTLSDVELEALARFYEASEYVSPEEFRAYTDYLLRNTTIQAWAWIAPAEDSDRSRFEEQARREGAAEYEFWEYDGARSRVVATQRKTYYPITRVSPSSLDTLVLGFDAASEPLRKAAIEEAVATGLTTCTAPLALVNEPDGDPGIVVCRPVFGDGVAPHLRGLALAVPRLGSILRGAQPNRAVELALTYASPDGHSIPVATTWDENGEPDHALTVTRPVFAFGRAFIVTAVAGTEFRRLHPMQAGWLVALAGLILTTSLATLTGVVHNKRQQLEELVSERTAELVEAERRIELAIDGADLGTWDWDVSSGVVTFNERWASKLGYSLDDITQNVGDWQKTLYADDLGGTIKTMTRHMNGQTEFYEAEHRLLHRDGHWIWVHARGRVLQRDADGNALRVCGTYLDITRRKAVEEESKKLQDQLVQVQKMEAVGRLAGGVAHDLNNLLSPIIGYGEMVLQDMDAEDENRESVDAMLRAGLRARDLVGQLLAFSRKQTLEFRPIDIGDTIREFEGLLRRTIPEDIDLKVKTAPDLMPVMADAGQIEQVIMNLAVNAADAMPDGGEMLIETVPAELDEEYASTRPDVTPGEYILLAVSDTGQGIDETTRERIFEPFFSTKGQLGTGLGLATVFGLIKQHQGNIWVYSEPGRGTTFKAYLPVAKDAHVEKETVSEAARDLSGTETILLVEDNEGVRMLARAILEKQGYDVLTAPSGADALEMVASHNGSLDLLLTDVVMPGMNGRELYSRMAPDHPQMRVLYMSGYTDNVIAHRGVLEVGIAYIQKPFTIRALAMKVRDVLDQ